MKIPEVVQSLWLLFASKDVSHRTSKHAAVLLKRGKVIAFAMNQLGSRSSGSGFSDRTIHAEKNVIKALGDIRLLKGSIMFVTR
jgi:tRNA(Arg) A34 adenosine deaminase TadA